MYEVVKMSVTHIEYALMYCSYDSYYNIKAYNMSLLKTFSCYTDLIIYLNHFRKEKTKEIITTTYIDELQCVRYVYEEPVPVYVYILYETGKTKPIIADYLGDLLNIVDPDYESSGDDE